MWPLVIRHFPGGIALRIKIWWYFSEPQPFKSKPNQKPVAADFQFSSWVIRYTLWGSLAARALTGASLLLLVWARSCHWDVYPWVFSTVLGCRWPESPGSFSMSLAPGGLCCAFTPSLSSISSQTHTHNTARLLVSACIFFFTFQVLFFGCVFLQVLLLLYFYLFYPFFLAIFLQLWHCRITSALMWIIIIEIKKERKKRKRQTQQEEPTESLWSSSLKSKYA